MPHVDGMGTIAFLEEVRGVFRREEGTEELLASPCVLGTRWKMQGQLEHSLHAILASYPLMHGIHTCFPEEKSLPTET